VCALEKALTCTVGAAGNDETFWLPFGEAGRPLRLPTKRLTVYSSDRGSWAVAELRPRLATIGKGWCSDTCSLARSAIYPTLLSACLMNVLSDERFGKLLPANTV